MMHELIQKFKVQITLKELLLVKMDRTKNANAIKKVILQNSQTKEETKNDRF